MVAALVVVAGCSGVSGPTGTPENGSATTAGGPPAEAPTTLTEDVLGRHNESLQEAGSFNATRTVGWGANGTNSSIGFGLRKRYRIDLENDRFVSRSSLVGNRTTFSNDSVTVVRRSVAGTVRYDTARHPGPGRETNVLEPDPVDVSRAMGVPSIVSEDDIEFRKTGTTTLEGVPVTRYEARPTDSNASLYEATLRDRGNRTVPSSRLGNLSDASKNVTVVLYVDEDGIVRKQRSVVRYRTPDGGESVFVLEHTISDVGEATMASQPSWVSDGISESDRSGGYARNCSVSASDIEGSFAKTGETADGSSYRYTVTSMPEDVASVEIEATEGNLFGKPAVLEGTNATIRDVPAGTTLEVVAKTICGDDIVLEEFTTGERTSSD